MQVNFHHLPLTDTTVIFKTSGFFIMVISLVNLSAVQHTLMLGSMLC